MGPGGPPPRRDRRTFDRDAWQRRWEGQDAADPLTWPGARGARLWLPVAAAFVVQVPFAVIRLLRPDVFGAAGPVALLGLAIAAAGPIALVAARRHPGAVVAVVSAAASADLLLREPDFGPPYIALAFAVGGAVIRGARVWAWVSLAVGWVATVVGGVVLDTPWRPPAVAGITFGILVVLGVAEAVRTRRDRFEQARRSASARRQTAVEAERVRIARELHDVLAHSLSQINVQAGVGLHLMETQPQKAAEALSNIKASSRSALDEVRSVLGVLRSGGAEHDPAALVPEPDLSRLDALVDSVATPGLSVSLDLDRRLDPPSAVQLAVYRIVQEALTNVVRHSTAGSVAVMVHGDATSVTVTISDDGAGSTASPEPGRGLLGMRERAELLGGTLSVTPSGAGFTVESTIPATERAGSAAGADR